MNLPIDPPWLRAARSQIGVREIPGPRHSPGVMGMVQRAKGWLGIAVHDDETPWCGTFVASCMAIAGFRPPRGAIGARAIWWAGWGEAISSTGTRPPLGSIAVFTRAGGGHVGFVVAVYENGDLDILGGNQANAVNIRRFPRARLTAFRWPPGAAMAGPAPWANAATQITDGNEA
ncbi:MAG: TIGR02594 family protein [Alphaproteobacteria bacterium]|nr:TIGR02594 family protein [Alphaproteobacteria bacterium]